MRWSKPKPKPKPRQVNLMLEVFLAVSLATGVASWMVGLDQARALTLVHALSGLALVALTPLKVRGSVRTGFRRGRATRWLSTGFGVVVLATVVLGVLHATGLWFGVGYWTALWTHLLLGFAAAPLLVWHVASRPVRPSVTDLDRRALLTTGGVVALAGGAVLVQEVGVRASGLAGARRAGTGSHELASFDPDRMPVVSWIDDRIPDLDPGAWPLRVQGRPVEVGDLAARSRPLDAVLDCTGGWRSEQRWDVVTVADLVDATEGRSVRVTSATGYSRLFSRAAADRIHLATGYGGRPLRRGHGAPLRLVAPGRRGPWWVKWVVEIEVVDRPAWFQLPFPTT